MAEQNNTLDRIRAINETAAFNRWMGLEVISAVAGFAEIRMPHRAEATQYTGFLHAGLVAALLDTACGYAAATIVGYVLASNISVNCLAPAVGDAFVARGTLVKAGKRQIFTRADLFAEEKGELKLVANGATILLRADM